ncbi:hypothetical protein BGZ95_011149 [Linnemannia exigua]|uniref:V-SNARE coiled-coil homology domain-containing protein n=1 Tax=Linnemannia exigua TaxID=604196 RepID=A0AAD4DM43_9FUNG|nr:hypothetical protein BGZ95_011149 [Linnemannia exigua]
MAFFNKIKNVVQTEGARGIRQVLQKEGTKRLAQDLSAHLDLENMFFCETRRFGLPALISAIAVDPVQGLLASGTFKGAIAVSGAPEVACFLELEEAVSVKMMTFQPGAPVLIVVDAKNAITIFDLIKKQRLFVRNARSVVTCIELLSGSNWLFHGLKDGTIDVFDVYRGQPVPYRIPNILPEGSRHSLVVSIKTHPTDSNQLLIAYNTGIILWNLKLKTVVRTYIYEIPPGAMGGIAVGDGSGMSGANESRYPHVTVISWKPNGLGFVSGYDDGCFVFWDITEERPVLARTIHEIQVNVPGIKPVFERATNQFIPIYQLTWCLHENKEDTTLIVAGGTGSVDMFGLHLFDYPAKADYRRPKRHQVLNMDTDILDFLVVPHSSPWYGGAFDPIAILVLTNRGGIRAFEFGQHNSPRTIPACLTLVEPRLILSKVYGPLPQDLYYEFIQGHTRTEPPPRVPLHGMRLAPVDESRLSRDILVTAHDDRSIRFWESATNRPLHHLTVELGPLFFKNQGDIVAFEFSIQSRVLAVGFSNGSWVYTRISKDAGLSRNSSVARTIPEESANEILAGHMEQTSLEPENRPGVTVVPGGAEVAQQTIDYKHAPGQPPSPQQTRQNPQHDPTSSQESKRAPQLLQEPNQTVPITPVASDAAPAPAPPLDIQTALATTPRSPQAIPASADNTGALSPVPDDDNLDYLIPYSPVEKVAIRELPPGGLIPGPAGPDRAPSPSLPPRPQFMEATLPNGSDFSTVFKSSAHLGRIRAMAVSGCGLVAVSGEFYSLTIADTASGRVIHVEDLKVVMLDRDKGPQGSHGNDQEQDAAATPAVATAPGPTPGPPGTVDVQALQRIAVEITTLQFVVSTTSDQDKVPSLLLIAGSNNGIYFIFAISPPVPFQPRTIRKVETFQTKEQYATVHSSVINVLSPSENAAAASNAAQQSTSSISSVSTAATGSTSLSSISQSSSVAHHDPANHQQQRQHPSGGLVSPPPAPGQPRMSREEEGFVSGHRASLSDSNVSTASPKPSIYSTFKEAQGKVMSKAHQRLNYLVCVSEFGIRLHMNCTSRRIHKIDLTSAATNNFSSKVGRILAANVVYHGGACCILCITESGRLLLFSVPKLELIPLPVPNGEIVLPIVVEPERLRESAILPDGRLFVPILKYEHRMYSLWGHDRWIKTPQGLRQEKAPTTDKEKAEYIHLYDHGIQIPPRPTSTVVVSKGWFGSSQSVEDAPSQEDLDALLGGEHYRVENPILKRAGVKGAPGSTPPPPPKGDGNSGIAGMMNETLQNLDERGKKLGILGDKTAEMSAASNDFLAAARELNAKNANKKWYEF